MLKPILLACAIALPAAAMAAPPRLPCSPYQSVCQTPPACPPMTPLMRWLSAIAPWYIATDPGTCPRY